MVSAVGRSHVRIITSSSIIWVVGISKLMLANAMAWCSFIPLYHFLHFTLPALVAPLYSFFLYADISSLDTILVAWSLLRCTFNVSTIFTGRVFDTLWQRLVFRAWSRFYTIFQTAKLTLVNGNMRRFTRFSVPRGLPHGCDYTWSVIARTYLHRYAFFTCNIAFVWPSWIPVSKCWTIFSMLSWRSHFDDILIRLHILKFQLITSTIRR